MLLGLVLVILYVMGVWVVISFLVWLFNLLIINVFGIQLQMYIVGIKLLEIYFVLLLLYNQVLVISVMLYNGMLYFGINVDCDVMSDVDLLLGLLS